MRAVPTAVEMIGWPGSSSMRSHAAASDRETMPPSAPPGRLERSDALQVRRRQLGRARGRDGEALEPLVVSPLAESDEPTDVAGAVGCEDDAHRRQDIGGYATPAEDDVDERAPGAAVAVVERVDRLELRVY